jgi:hypothetical protein
MSVQFIVKLLTLAPNLTRQLFSMPYLRLKVSGHIKKKLTHFSQMFAIYLKLRTNKYFV